MSSYEELIVWQKAMDLVAEVYRIVKLLPKEEIYALSDQMRRAAVSIPSNTQRDRYANHPRSLQTFCQWREDPMLNCIHNF